MRRLLHIAFKALHPPAAVTAVLVPLAGALLIGVFVRGAAHTPLAFAAYLLSAYALAVVCARLPGLVRRVRAFRQQNRYLRRYFEDPALRVRLSLYCSLGLNTLYALMQAWAGFINRSVWYYALCGYYLLLGAMRFSLLRHTRRPPAGPALHAELTRYRRIGWMLLGMHSLFSAIVFYIVRRNHGFSHSYVLTIAMAAYTFYALTMAIIQLIKYRKYNSPVLSAARAVSLAAALVSMLSLETSMLAAFGGEHDPLFRQRITGTTGTAVGILILAMAVYMIVHATRQLRHLKEEASEHGR